MSIIRRRNHAPRRPSRDGTSERRSRMLADMMGQAQDIAARLNDPETRDAMLASIEDIAAELQAVLDLKA